MYYMEVYIGIVLAAIAAMIIGSLWYGPFFGTAWMSLVGKSQKDIEQTTTAQMVRCMVAGFVVVLVMAGVLSCFIQDQTMFEAAKTAAWLWLGFVATTGINEQIWEGRPMKLFWLNSIYNLIILEVMVVILIALA